MGKFTNLKSYVEPETTLFQQEVDVILAVIDQVLASFNEYPTQGTFILDGQKMGERAKCILRFNLEKGAYYPVESDSDTIVAGAINRALAWPDILSYGYNGESRFFGQLPSKIYQQKRMKVLVLNTTYGRFLMSFYANSGCSACGDDKDIALYQAMAETFAQIGKEDKVLQWSVKRVQAQATDLEKDAIFLVKNLFQDCIHPTFQAWKEWHEPANNSGELTLFFE